MKNFELAWHHEHDCKCPVVTRLQSINLTMGSLVNKGSTLRFEESRVKWYNTTNSDTSFEFGVYLLCMMLMVIFKQYVPGITPII